jgi:hypothetical protein
MLIRLREGRVAKLEPSEEKKVAVMIPEDLFDDISKSIQNKGFSKVDDFVSYVLRIVVGKRASDFQKEDDEVIMRQLKGLGYV